jgi:hypothetical protein
MTGRECPSKKKNFPKKLFSGGIIEKNACVTNAFLWEKFNHHLFTRLKRNAFESFTNNYNKK